MNKREKILVAFSAIALLGGLFYLFVLPLFSDTQNSSEQGGDAVNSTQIAKIDRSLLSAQLMVKEKQTIDSLVDLVETDWKKDPFKVPQAEEDSTMNVSYTPDSLDYIYSGFIQIGSQYLAVINGMEYSPGEIIQDSMYTLGQISPDKIILNRDGKKALTLYLKED